MLFAQEFNCLPKRFLISNIDLIQVRLLPLRKSWTIPLRSLLYLSISSALGALFAAPDNGEEGWRIAVCSGT